MLLLLVLVLDCRAERLTVLSTLGPLGGQNQDTALLQLAHSPALTTPPATCSGFTYCFRVYFNVLNNGEIFGFTNRLIKLKAAWPNLFFQ